MPESGQDNNNRLKLHNQFAEEENTDDLIVKVHPTIVKTRKFGDFEILFQYVNEEPALVVRAHRFLSVRKRAYVITLESAWKYVDDVESPHSGHSKYMVYASAQIESMLGLGDSISTRFRIAEAIMDCLEDLLAMKPMKIEKEQSVSVGGTVHIGDQSFEVNLDADPQTINSTEGMQKIDTPRELAREDL